MPQFAVYRNDNPASRDRYPLLVDVQSDLLEALQSRVVIPMSRRDTFGNARMTRLMPVLSIDGMDYVLVTPQPAGIDRRELGVRVGDLVTERDEIISAMDFLMLGF